MSKTFAIFSIIFLALSILFFIDSNNKTNVVTGFFAYIDVDFSKIEYSEVDIPVNNSITFSLDGKDLNDLRIVDPEKNTIKTYINGKLVYFAIGEKKGLDLNLDSKTDIEIKFDNYFSNKVHAVLTRVTCATDWYCTEYTPCVGNAQTRQCTDKNNCQDTKSKPETSRLCQASCDDDIQNQGEKGIDCGGPCVAPCQDSKIIYLWAFIPILIAIVLILVTYIIIRKKEKPYRALEKPLIKELGEDKDYIKDAVKQSGMVPKSKEELEALQQLEDYINEALTRRASISEIKDNLLSVGWEERIVDLTLTKIVKKRR